MKKLLKQFFAILIFTTTSLTTVACTFNLSEAKVQAAIANNLASETANIIKSLIISRHKKVNFSRVLNDLFSKLENSSLDKNLNDTNTINKFNSIWGKNKKIETDEAFDTLFDQTKNSENFSNKNIIELLKNNETLRNNQKKFSLFLEFFNNQLLLNYVFNNKTVSKKVISFLNTAKKIANNKNIARTINYTKNKTENPGEIVSLGLAKLTDTPSTIINNGKGNNESSNFESILRSLMVDNNNSKTSAFTENFINPLKSLINNLIHNSWDEQSLPPKNIEELSNYMSNWKDINGRNFSSWVENGKWNIKPEFPMWVKIIIEQFIGKKLKETTNSWKMNDYYIYRGGVLLNQLFYKISAENNLTWENNKNKRDLGDIISQHIELSLNFTKGLNKIVNLNVESLVQDLNQYFKLLFSKSTYIFQLLEAFLPILKIIILEVPELNQEIKTVVFSEKSNQLDKNTVFFNEIINNIKKVINNTDNIINKIVGSLLSSDNISSLKSSFSTFLYDIKIKKEVKLIFSSFIKIPLPMALNIAQINNPSNIDLASQKFTKFLNKGSINLFIEKLQTYYNNYYNYYKQWSVATKNKDYELDLIKLKKFLFDEKNNENVGILQLIDNEIIKGSNGLLSIINNPRPIESIESKDYLNFFSSIGANLNSPGKPISRNFKENSLITRTLLMLKDKDHILGNLVNLIMGSPNIDLKNLSIIDKIIIDNQKIIDEQYFDYINENNNKVKSEISNIKSNVTTNNNLELTNISYELKYKIDDHEYNFIISGVKEKNLNENLSSYKFYFTSIKTLEKR